jgi:hypothetical protein
MRSSNTAKRMMTTRSNSYSASCYTDSYGNYVCPGQYQYQY